MSESRDVGARSPDRLERAIAWLAASPPGAGSFWLTRFVFLRLLGVVYFFAFLSLAHQVLPLIGENGLLPVDDWLARAQANIGGSRLDAFFVVPSIFWAGSSDATLVAFAWVGVGLSLVVALGIANSLLMSALWFLYMSFVNVGQDWFHFGWESQLLETGFLAIFFCPLLDPRPFPRRAPPEPVIWLLRWLSFRIMLGAGLIKMRGDHCWRDLSCLFYHYETQPIPNPISALLHFAPHWFHELGCIFNHFIELIVPFLIWWPPRVRRVAGVLMILFQAILIASGNLSFLNWLTICPCLACLDDGVWRRVLPRRMVARAELAADDARPSVAQVFVARGLVVLVALLSIPVVANLLQLTRRQIMNTSFDRLRLVNTYGAFGSVGRERYEIVIEGTDALDPTSSDARWRAYEFKAKPGDPARRPPFTAPYHYRVDWEIWFAAMSSRDEHPWLVHLIWKLLHNDELALSLLANRPFPDRPPRFIRAELYRYRFAPLGSAAWWERERVRAWLRPVSVDDDELRAILDENGWLHGRF